MENNKAVAKQLYEEWMDYKAKNSRSPSIISKESLKENKTKSKFVFANDYTYSTSPDSSAKHESEKGETGQNKEEKNISDQKKLIKTIKKDFESYYKWVANGKKDDLNPEHITAILFPKKK